MGDGNATNYGLSPLPIIRHFIIARYPNCLEQLLISIKINDAQKLKTLLATSNVNLEAMDENGNTPLLLAAFYGHDRCVDALLNNGGANYKHINFLGTLKFSTIYLRFIEIDSL